MAKIPDGKNGMPKRIIFFHLAFERVWKEMCGKITGNVPTNKNTDVIKLLLTTILKVGGTHIQAYTGLVLPFHLN